MSCAKRIIDKCIEEVNSSSAITTDFLLGVTNTLKENCLTNIDLKIKNIFLRKIDAILSAKNKSSLIEEICSINYIRIVDSGIGMSKDTLESVFLTVGTGFKMNSGGDILGNKGIGRLAMMRLGKKSTITSWENINNAHKIVFNWKEFESSEKRLLI